MNQHIRALAEQAGMRSPDLFKLTVAHMSVDTLQEFANMIVRECLGIVDDAERGGSNDIWDNAVKFIRRDLQEHFGVEE